MTATQQLAVVTGGSAGLGLELVRALASDGWRVITDARDRARLDVAVGALSGDVWPIAGDVTDPEHRTQLAAKVREIGRLDLLVHNASTLGPTPLPRLDQVGSDAFDAVWATNAVAPALLTAALLPELVRAAGVVLAISSDAAVEHYEGWGLYGASKAAADHLTLTMGEENPQLRTYAVDPGDMRTQMHQDAFPGEDISDRPLPQTVVPQLMKLIASRPANGRYRVADLVADDAAPNAEALTS